MYLTITEYADYSGTAPDSAVFQRLLIRAESEIDLRTFGRVARNWSTLPLEVQTRVKNAVAEMIYTMETEPAEERRVKSESVGSHSVTYEYNEKESDIYSDVIKRHLLTTGLLYRGILYGN